MTCTTIKIGDAGDMAIVCDRKPIQKCQFCAPSPRATKLCDYPLAGSKRGKTCSARMCDRCATTIDGLDYCRAHLRFRLEGDPTAAHAVAERLAREQAAADAWLDRLVEEQNVAELRGAARELPSWSSVPEHDEPAPVVGEIGAVMANAYVDSRHAWFCPSYRAPEVHCDCEDEDVRALAATQGPSDPPADTRAALARAESIDAKVTHVRRASQTREHTCHWPGCDEQVKPAVWGCLQHWRMVPKRLRDKIWREYRVGQETSMTPSRAYVEVAREVEAWILINHPPRTDAQEARASAGWAIDRIEQREAEARRAVTAERDAVELLADAFEIPGDHITRRFNADDVDPRDPRGEAPELFIPTDFEPEL